MAAFITPVAKTITNDGTWRDIDCSADIAADATGVMLEIVNTSGGTLTAGVRKNGSTDDILTNSFIGVGEKAIHYIGVDGSRIFEARSNGTANFNVVGYFTTDAVFFDNRIQKTQSVSNTWEAKSVASDTGSDTAIAVMGITNSYRWGVRKTGSTDTRRSASGAERFQGFIIGVDGSEQYDMNSETTGYSTYIVGYIKSNAVFNTNGVDRSTGTTGAYEDIAALNAAAIGGIYESHGAGSVALRANGASHDIYAPVPNQKSYGPTAVDGSQVAEQKISATTLDLYEIGYFTLVSTSSPPALTDVDSDETFASTATGVTFTGTDLGADETERDVYLVQGAVEVEQTQGSGDDTGGVFDVVGFGLGGLLKYGVATTLKVVTSEGEDELSVTVSPPSGYAYVDLASIHSVEDERITAVPDLEVGDQLEYETVGDKVEIHDDATFTVDDETVTEFDVRAFDTEWGAVGTQEIDDGTAPDAFSFVDQTDVELSTVCTSAPVTIEGIEAPNSPITVSGGEYSINGGAFTSDAGTVGDGDEVRARVTSSGSYETGATATVTIGGVSDGFTATTRAQVAPTITTTTLADGHVGSPYSRTLAATGDGPFTWSVTVGALPDGLALDDETGAITGTPTTEETANFTVQAENAAGTDDQALSILIGAELEGSGIFIFRRRGRR